MRLCLKLLVSFHMLGLLMLCANVGEIRAQGIQQIENAERQASDLLEKRGCLLVKDELGRVVQATLGGENVTVENIDQLKHFPELKSIMLSSSKVFLSTNCFKSLASLEKVRVLTIHDVVLEEPDNTILAKWPADSSIETLRITPLPSGWLDHLGKFENVGSICIEIEGTILDCKKLPANLERLRVIQSENNFTLKNPTLLKHLESVTVVNNRSTINEEKAQTD